jgi:hypothetical protein
MNFDLSAVSIGELIERGESKWLEFKANVPPDHAIAKYIAAFANTEGGTILFGIGDRGTVIGIPENKVSSDVVRLKRLATSVLPYPSQIGALEYEGKTILYMTIDPAPEPLQPIMTAQGEIFTRHAAAIHQNSIAQRLVRDAGAKEAKSAAPQALTVFVAMSFREEEEPALVDYFRAMERAAARASADIRLSRIDLVEGDYEISQKIMDEIDKCQVLIADFTLSPRNVYFELGYCRARKNIQVIQTARKDTVLEFDVRNWRTLFYKNASELEEKLLTALQDAIAKAKGAA